MMVNIVNNHSLELGYRETNLQLARENEELKQQLSQAHNEIMNYKEETMKKNVEIHRLNIIENKYNHVVEVVLDLYEKEGSRLTPIPFPLPRGNERRSAALSIAGSGSDEDESTQSKDTLPAPILDRISERLEEDEQESASTLRDSYSDSLDPREVTSVPPINMSPERTPHTPSVFNILDTLKRSNESTETLKDTTNFHSPIQRINGTAKNNINQDMFHSTPVQDRENLKNKKKLPAKRAITQNPEPHRYNLRKRSKK